MTERRRRTSEYLLPVALFPTLPEVGSYLACPGKTEIALLLSVVRKVSDDGRPMVRLAGTRFRTSEYPPDITPMPWPRQKPPSRAAETPPATDKPAAIVTKAVKARIERDRIRNQRRDYASDPANQLVDPVRWANGSAVAGTWRDPDDRNVLRKTPRAITGFRATDTLVSLQQSGTLTRQLVGAARRLRGDYENGCLQANGATDWARGGVSSGGTPVGISERVLQFLERFQRAQTALGRSFEIVEIVVLQERTLKAYAERHGIQPAAASGRLFAALQRLQDWYDSIDPTPVERERATIGAQLGPAA